ncbi:MAG: hypothetical protein HYV07_16915 [Deltaproteobacteria bacterium]|nr:hypothetical protein [Deltaproteobacteria bacterium]
MVAYRPAFPLGAIAPTASPRRPRRDCDSPADPLWIRPFDQPIDEYLIYASAFAALAQANELRSTYLKLLHRAAEPMSEFQSGHILLTGATQQPVTAAEVSQQAQRVKYGALACSVASAEHSERVEHGLERHQTTEVIRIESRDHADAACNGSWFSIQKR